MSWTITVKGNTYTDADMAGYGYIAKWPAMLADAATDYAAKAATMSGYMNVALSAAASATDAQNAAAGYAATALNAPGTSATSTTSMPLGTGQHTITVQPGKSIVPGMSITCAVTASASSNHMWGVVDSYNGTTGVLVFTVPDAAAVTGTGTYAAWTVALSGVRGAQGLAGAMPGWVVKTGAYTASNGDRICANTIGGAWTLTLPASPSAGHAVRVCDGGGAFAINPLTINPNGSTIAGVSGNQTISTSNLSVEFVYNGATWRFA